MLKQHLKVKRLPNPTEITDLAAPSQRQEGVLGGGQEPFRGLRDGYSCLHGNV